ncbi:hypothetical protein H311_01946, partial [Anncaliia algerae PRA109]
DNIISRLRYNRISIILYFASLIFRIKNLETFCDFRIDDGHYCNLFQIINRQNIYLIIKSIKAYIGGLT